MTLPAPPSNRRLALLLGGLAMFGPFSIDTIFPAFPQIGTQFGADKLAMQQTISVYLLAYAAMSLVHGPLSDALGRRRVILGGLLVFALASTGCALATSLPQLLAFRALQGLSAGVGFIVGRAVIRDVLHGHDAQRLMSQVSMIFGIAPAIAPVIGGWLLGWQQWTAIFWFLYIASAPAFVLDLLKLGERDFGWFFIPMIGGMMVGAFISGRLAGKLDGRRQVRIGYACCGVGTLLNLAYTLMTVQPTVPWAVLPLALYALGLGLVSPILTLAILDMFPQQRGSASSLQAFVTLLINAIIAGVLSPWLSGSGLALAVACAVFALAGWICLRWEARAMRRFPDGQSPAAALEPTDQM